MKTLFFPICFIISLFASAQKADLRIAELLQTHNHFQLQKELPQLEKTANPQLSLFAKAFVQHYFNQPAQSNQSFKTLLDMKSPLVEGDNFLAAILFMADNYARMFQYAEAAAAYEQLVDSYKASGNDADIASYQIQNRFYNSLKEIPPQEIYIPEKITKIPVTFDSLPTIPITLNGQAGNFILDAGANFSMIPQSAMEKYGITVLTDSIWMAGGTGSGAYTKFGVAKELKIGSIVVKNVIFAIAPDDILPEACNFEIKGILGISILNALPEIHIYKKGILEIVKEPQKRNLAPNLLLSFNSLFSQAFTSQDTLFMHFDTGAKASSLVGKYYEEHKQEIEQQGTKGTIRQCSYGGFREDEIYTLSNFALNIAGSKIKLDTIPAILKREQINEFEFDGVLGSDLMNHSKKMVLNLKEMYLYFE